MKWNRTLARCSACGAECKQHVYGWMKAAEFVSWFVFASVCLRWLNRLPLVAGVLVGLPFVMLWFSACDRLYHAWFLRRHPARCGGGGEPEPEPTG